MNIKKSKIVFSSLIVAVILIAACSPKQVSSTVNPVSPTDQPSAAQVATQVIPTTNSSSNTADACTLLTKDEVSSVLGVTVISAESKGLGGVCTYKTDKLGIDLTLSNTGGLKAMNTTKTNLGDLALDVPGLGDMAFYNTNSANALFVLKGDAEYLFNISDLNYQPLDVAFVQATEKALAEKLLSNLN